MGVWDYASACGTPALDRLLERLEERGYRRSTNEKQVEGEYSYKYTDGAPGWSDWMYEIAIHLRDGDTLKQLLEGLER
jgi:hypothetical protein